jgi:hypothetical protein
MTLRGQPWAKEMIEPLEYVQIAMIYIMLAATIGSGLQYCWKAAKLVNA